MVDFYLPKYHLRGKIVADAQGRYEYRTVVPGVEPAAVPVGRLDDLPRDRTLADRVDERIAVEPERPRRTWVERAKRYLGITMKTVRRPPDVRGFVVFPRRWAVEQGVS